MKGLISNTGSVHFYSPISAIYYKLLINKCSTNLATHFIDISSSSKRALVHICVNYGQLPVIRKESDNASIVKVQFRSFFESVFEKVVFSMIPISWCFINILEVVFLVLMSYGNIGSFLKCHSTKTRLIRHFAPR